MGKYEVKVRYDEVSDFQRIAHPYDEREDAMRCAHTMLDVYLRSVAPPIAVLVVGPDGRDEWAVEVSMWRAV